MPETLLLFNRRALLDELPHWFPDSRERLVVLTDRSSLGDDGVAARAATAFRHLEPVEDYEDASVLELAEQLCRRFGVARILTTAEVDVPRAARLRARLGLQGQSEQSAAAYTDKHVMKQIAASAGVPVAPMQLVTHGAGLAAFARHHGLPVVVKRLSGGSAIGQSVLRDDAALAAAVESWPWNGPMLAEAWVQGQTFHVDGLIQDGKVVHCQPSVYLNTQWETMSAGRDWLSGMLHPEDPVCIAIAARTAEVVAALPAPPGGCAIHAEFFWTPDRGAVLCEIACRPGGGGVVEAYRHSFGVDLYQATLFGQAGLAVPEPEPAGRTGFGWFAPRHGVLRAQPEHCPLPGVIDYTPRGVIGRRYAGPRSVSHNVARVLFTLPDDDLDPRPRLRAFEDWWLRAEQWTDRG